MIELFSIIHGTYSINGISITDLNDLFNNNDTKTYEISMIGKNKIILKNKEDNKFEKLDCICNYFDINTNDCVDIKKNITCCGDCDSCKECYKKALQKLESGELSLK